MFFQKTKYNLKFLIKIQYENEENLIINQIAPTLNQLGLDETNHFDDFIYTFFIEHYQTEFSDTEIYTSTVRYSIWKNSAQYHQISIKPFIFYEFCYKYHKNLLKDFNFFDSFHFYKNQKDWYYRFYVNFFFFFFLTEATSWNSDLGFQFSFKKFQNSFSSFIGIEKSYAKRQEMLGRKINFRRKLQKKKFEDY